MSAYRPVDSKREEFRKYLEKAGAMDALTKVLVMLYDEPEKPADALEYIRKHLGDHRPDEAEFELLKNDLEAASLKIQTLEDEVKVLKERLAQYEPEGEATTEEEEAKNTTSSDGATHSAPAEESSEPTAHAEEAIPTQ